MSCLKMNRFGAPCAGDADEALIVIFDDAAHFLVIAQFHADGNLAVDQMLQVLDLFEGLLGRARALCLWIPPR